jgi:hypothetical protein
MSTEFSFKVTARDGAARSGEISTPRGRIRTPAFMPVGTAGTVKAMYADQVHALGCGRAPSASPSSAGCINSCNGNFRF